MQTFTTDSAFLSSDKSESLHSPRTETPETVGRCQGKGDMVTSDISILMVRHRNDRIYNSIAHDQHHKVIITSGNFRFSFGSLGGQLNFLEVDYLYIIKIRANWLMFKRGYERNGLINM